MGDAAGVGRFPLFGFSQGSKASVRRISESPALADALKAALHATQRGTSKKQERELQSERLYLEACPNRS